MRSSTGGGADSEGREFDRVVYPREVIARRVREMGEEIGSAYPEGEALLVLGLLKGSFIFLADLVRQIRRPLTVDFAVAASYGSNTESTGAVRLLYEPEMAFEGRHVLLVEDIIDSGNTLNRLIPLLRKRTPKSLELCTLLHKRTATSLIQDARWVGFDAPDEFLVGYGLDYSENFRNLPFVASLLAQRTE